MRNVLDINKSGLTIPNLLFKRTKLSVRRLLNRSKKVINSLPVFDLPVVFSNGATVHVETTLNPEVYMRTPYIRLVKDRYTHPLWNPGKVVVTEDESGKLKRFNARYSAMINQSSSNVDKENETAKIASSAEPVTAGNEKEAENQKKNLKDTGNSNSVTDFFAGALEGLNFTDSKNDKKASKRSHNNKGKGKT